MKTNICMRNENLNKNVESKTYDIHDYMIGKITMQYQIKRYMNEMINNISIYLL